MNYLPKTKLRESYVSPHVELLDVVVEAGFTYSSQETGAPSFGGDEEDWDQN